MFKNFANTSHNLGRVKMLINQPHLEQPNEDWGQILSKFLVDYKNQQNEQALTDALQSGDQGAIDKAAAAYDPQGFYNSMQKIKQARELSDLDFARQKELLGLKNKYNLDAMERRAKLAQDIALIKAGKSLNPDFNVANLTLGKKETDTDDEESRYKNAALLAGVLKDFSPQLGMKGMSGLMGKNGMFNLGAGKDALFDMIKSTSNPNQMQNAAGGNVDTAQMGLDTLKDIADRDSVGAWTRFRKGLKLTSDQEEKDLGAISSSIAAIAPQAISKLKAAGVSGINTMAEFLTYLGLPENPISAELKGALPQIAAILGKNNPYGQQTNNPQQTQINYKSKYGLD